MKADELCLDKNKPPKWNFLFKVLPQFMHGTKIRQTNGSVPVKHSQLHHIPPHKM